jgi:hypothetical protein
MAAVVGTFLLAAVIVTASLISAPDPAAAEPMAAAPQMNNGCTGAFTQTAKPDTVRICDPSDVEVNVAPVCPMCPGGMKVVFVQREEATEARWQNSEAVSALEELEKLYSKTKLQVAVVQYGPGGARAVARMSDRLTQARSALNRPKTVANPDDANAKADEAAREALRQLEPGRDEDRSIPVCKLVIFFAQDSPTPG